jgi:hypothetical protein
VRIRLRFLNLTFRLSFFSGNAIKSQPR